MNVSIPTTPVSAPSQPAARISGRQLAACIGAAAGFAILLAAVTTAIARALAPHWSHTDGLTVLIVAEVYLAIIAGLVVGTGGPARAKRLLALHRPEPGQVGFALALLVAACAAGLAVSMAFSPLSGGPVATLEAIVRAGSDESRMPTATPLVWALIVVRIVALAGVAEELLFRGALYGWLRRRLSVPATITVTTALFALEHGYYPVLIPLVVAAGLALGWVRHRTHTTTAGIPMHIALDLALFIAALALA
jgi:membrane protease YdiL (CAAX protease family)